MHREEKLCNSRNTHARVKNCWLHRVFRHRRDDFGQEYLTSGWTIGKDNNGPEIPQWERDWTGNGHSTYIYRNRATNNLFISQRETHCGCVQFQPLRSSLRRSLHAGTPSIKHSPCSIRICMYLVLGERMRHLRIKYFANEEDSSSCILPQYTSATS